MSTDESAREDRTVSDFVCPRCGCRSLDGRHCKLVCSKCGYVESCEDIFPAAPPSKQVSNDEIELLGSSDPP